MLYDNEIGDLCLKSFNKLVELFMILSIIGDNFNSLITVKVYFDQQIQVQGKSGKPNLPNEYTVLAAIVCDYKHENQQRKVVALTTGTKCFPSNQCTKYEHIVDSHAESLLKRAFKRFLISRLESGSHLDDISSVSLFVSQFPCGTVQRWQGDSSLASNNNMGAPNFNRKPGRGEACLRATCLMKINKWVFMGLQGKALIQFTKRPIYINNIVIGNCGPIGEYNEHRVENWFALENNTIAYKPFEVNNLPKIKFCEDFRNDLFVKTESNKSSATSIVMWLTGDGQISEVVTEGRKLGVTKKNALKSQLLISDSIINRDINLLKNEKNPKLCETYENQWNQLKKCSLFDGWHSLTH